MVGNCAHNLIVVTDPRVPAPCETDELCARKVSRGEFRARKSAVAVILGADDQRLRSYRLQRQRRSGLIAWADAEPSIVGLSVRVVGRGGRGRPWIQWCCRLHIEGSVSAVRFAHGDVLRATPATTTCGRPALESPHDPELTGHPAIVVNPDRGDVALVR